MISVKEEVYKGLLQAFSDLNIPVYDYYPEELEKFPVIVYFEENNTVYEVVDDTEVTSQVVYRVDVWHKESTTEIAKSINKVFMTFGLRRVACSDAPDVSGLRHKMMKFEGIVDNTTRLVYAK